MVRAVSWRSRAGCADKYLHDWLGEEITVGMARICMDCPVRLDCLGEALGRNYNDDVGVWGGTTAAQRFAIRENRLRISDVWEELREAVGH